LQGSWWWPPLAMANIKRRSTQVRREDHGNMDGNSEDRELGTYFEYIVQRIHTVHVGSTFARRLATLVGFAAEIVPVPSIAAECARVIG